MEAATARRLLVRQLQGAFAGETAAIRAYAGHGRSVADPAERERIARIEAEERHHRELVGQMLRGLGAGPSPWRQAVFVAIGSLLGPLCHVSGWFLPMYGAGRLESGNVREYEVAARYAVAAGCPEQVDCLLAMAEVEWDHEQYFRGRVEGHWLLRLFPLWPPLPPRASIREKLAA
jgi:rubrerythrin